MNTRHDWTLDELRELNALPVLDLIYQSATVHREHHAGSEVQRCQLLSIKTGGCPEDCKYCSQSMHNKTDVKAEPLMKRDAVLAEAKRAKENGATRFCMGAAWREVREGKQFDEVLEMIRGVNAMGLEVCCTLGMVNADQAKRLKVAGLHAYNHNLDTSEDYYDSIISTRSYEDRLRTLQNVRDAGLTVCCGGILGLGEEVDDRLKLLQTLATMDPHPESVPINMLAPSKGTPLATLPDRIPFWEFVRVVAIARIIMPKSMVRLSAQRRILTDVEQGMCFLAGANSIFVGNKLLTVGNAQRDADDDLFETLGLQGRVPFKEEAVEAVGA